MADIFDKVSDTADDIYGVMRDAKTTGNKVTRVTKPFTNAVSTATPAQSKATPTAAPATYTNANSGQVSPTSAAGSSASDIYGSPIEKSSVTGRSYYTNVAPEGTRMIIPSAISSTGQERYVGTDAFASILALEKKEKGAGNIVVMGEDGKPSLKYYDAGPNGEILIKGTQIPANVKPEGDNASVRLSEAEYEAILRAKNTKTDKAIYFKTSAEKGQSENSSTDSSSWFGRNWWKILLGMVAVGGVVWGGIAWSNSNRKSKTASVSNTDNNTGNTGGTGGNGGTDNGNGGSGGNSGNDGGTLSKAGHQLKDLNMPDFSDSSKPIWKADENIR